MTNNKTAQELALREKIIQVRRDNTDCGCVPCDRYCREMRELVINVIDEVLAEIDASFKALTPPVDKPNVKENAIPLTCPAASVNSINKPSDDAVREALDDSGHLIIQTMANNFNKQEWVEEFNAGYTEEKWFNSIRAAMAFLSDKVVPVSKNKGGTIEGCHALCKRENFADTPEGYALVPVELTAENGMKGLLSGEFYELVDQLDENGYEVTPQKVYVSWDNIKKIHRAMVSAHLKEGK